MAQEIRTFVPGKIVTNGEITRLPQFRNSRRSHTVFAEITMADTVR
jgi:hypothetical protein